MWPLRVSTRHPTGICSSPWMGWNSVSPSHLTLITPLRVLTLTVSPTTGGGTGSASTATPQGTVVVLVRLWSAPVPSRLARPIVSVLRLAQ